MIVVLNDDGMEILFLESIIPSNYDKNIIMVFHGIIWEFMAIVNRIG